MDDGPPAREFIEDDDDDEGDDEDDEPLDHGANSVKLGSAPLAKDRPLPERVVDLRSSSSRGG